ncbi:neuronal acetylcholine receptor subunit alpha-10-like [Argonauta hians]
MVNSSGITYFIGWLLTLIPVCCCGRIPDEQRLYRDLMTGYEKSVRPVINASTILLVRFGLRLNQIVDLDERHQVLTTNVFIDQEWSDENLYWEPGKYNSVRSLRVPAKNVWLPDTFIYNNADDGSTGFMQGTYVLVNHNGSVLWPVPVKLKSSCKVDITYFPFDDQQCILRFGSWIYSGLWIDYITMMEGNPVDLTTYVNNSEWDLLDIRLDKNIRTHSCCPDPHPDMTYTLYIRRRTFYYIFNIIIPCVMLSALTLLTFWLPPTSGEKITLGLSVFLAFSMFMLLIAEQVPATSESVPLIGIYLCLVMTMTSVSVIMAVMVINLYNRGMKTRRAPKWLRKLVLEFASSPLKMKHDIEHLAKVITLTEEKEGLYTCTKHGKDRKQNGTIGSIAAQREKHPRSLYDVGRVRHRRYTKTDVDTSEPIELQNDDEGTWLREEEIIPENTPPQPEVSDKSPECENNNHFPRQISVKRENEKNIDFECKQSDEKWPCAVYQALLSRKIVVAEWQRIACVIDRFLFWIYFISTIVAYLVILVIIPGQRQDAREEARRARGSSIFNSTSLS